MKIQLLMSRAVLGLSCLLPLHAVFADESDTAYQVLNKNVAELDARYPAFSILTAESAETAVQVTTQTEAEMEYWFDRQQISCYDKFFMNACIKDGKLKRRGLVLVLHRINIEAKALQRKLHIDQLDRDLAEKNKDTPAN
jgi:hypothetical protein